MKENLNPIQLHGFTYPESMDDESVPSGVRFDFERAHRAFGSNDLDSIFKGHDKTTAPWPRAGRTKTTPLYDQARVDEALRQPPRLEDVDPRNLHSTQPSVVRHHAAFYFDQPDYRLSGTTSADQNNVGNQYPTVYHDRRGRNLLLTGHHRATVDLVRGRMLRARMINE